MRVLRFHGYSDDTFGEYGVMDLDWDNCASGKPITFKVTAGKESLYVTGQYNRLGNGCWDVSVTQVREGDNPTFPIRVFFEVYSTVVEIEVPDDFIVEHVDEKEFAV